MNIALHFEAPFRVVGYQRSDGNGRRRFTPKATRECMQAIKALALAANPRKIPKTHYARVEIVFGYEGRVRPDSDNAVKTVLDSLTGIAYHDDKQVAGRDCQRISLFECAENALSVTVYEGEARPTKQTKATGNRARVSK